MNSYFHDCNYFIFSLKSYESQVLKQMKNFFTDMEYEEIENFGILYKKYCDPKLCLVSYLEYNIDYYEYIINLSTQKWTRDYQGKTDVIDFSSVFEHLLPEWKTDLEELIFTLQNVRKDDHTT